MRENVYKEKHFLTFFLHLTKKLRLSAYGILAKMILNINFLTNFDQNSYECYIIVQILLKWSMTSEIIIWFKTPLLIIYLFCLKSDLFMNANLIKRKLFHDMKFDLKGHWRSHMVIFKMSWKGFRFFYFVYYEIDWPYKTLNYVLIDNFCPCLYFYSQERK